MMGLGQFLWRAYELRKTAHELSAGIVNLGTSRMGTVTAGCLEQDKVETVAVWQLRGMDQPQTLVSDLCPSPGSWHFYQTVRLLLYTDALWCLIHVSG